MIAIDWGTTHVRAYLLGRDGRILARKFGATGAMSVVAGGYADALETLVGPWLERDEGPVLMSGMVGSRQGWVEVPYVHCPASLEDVVAGVATVRWGENYSAFIAPGLICRDQSGIPDVLRGEEIQAFGAVPDLPPGEALLFLPGTHSKHLRLRDGIIESFVTHMTGEIYSMLRQHSILGRIMGAQATEVDQAAFDAGIARASEPGGLSHHLFGVRARALTGEISAQETSSYLSGILIGHEVIAAGPADSIFIIGSPDIGGLYLRALERKGARATLIAPDVAATGLFRVARSLPESKP